MKYDKSPMGLGLKATIDEYILKKDQSQPLGQESSVTTETSGEDKNNDEEGEDEDEEACELDLTGIDDDEIDGYIMTSAEIEQKTNLWMKVNAEYLKAKAEKEEKARLEMEEALKEGKSIKPKSKVRSKRNKGNRDLSKQHHDTALEAIEKMVAEKKISTKINYDVLKSLNTACSPAPQVSSPQDNSEQCTESEADLLSPQQEDDLDDKYNESAAQLLSQHRGEEETMDDEFEMF